MKKWLFLALLGCIVALHSCGTTGSGSLYVEPSIEREDVKIQRVAIVPNRLPLNLQNPEKWRKYNWGITKQEFESRGFEVVDYKTSVSTFKSSGLPVEDTKSSRDKYAELADKLGVDIIIIPYYGTFSEARNIILLFNNVSYSAVATFQMYFSNKNDFFSRSDVNGKNQYTTGLITAGGIFSLSFLARVAGKENSYGTKEPNKFFKISGLILLIGGGVYDLVQSLIPSDYRWKLAFEKAIQEGLKPFWKAYKKPAVRVKSVKEPEASVEQIKEPAAPVKSVKKPAEPVKTEKLPLISAEPIKETVAPVKPVNEPEMPIVPIKEPEVPDESIGESEAPEEPDLAPETNTKIVSEPEEKEEIVTQLQIGKMTYIILKNGKKFSGILKEYDDTLYIIEIQGRQLTFYKEVVKGITQ